MKLTIKRKAYLDPATRSARVCVEFQDDESSFSLDVTKNAMIQIAAHLCEAIKEAIEIEDELDVN